MNQRVHAKKKTQEFPWCKSAKCISCVHFRNLGSEFKNHLVCWEEGNFYERSNFTGVLDNDVA